MVSAFNAPLFSPSPQAQVAAEVNHLTFTNESKLLFP